MTRYLSLHLPFLATDRIRGAGRTAGTSPDAGDAAPCATVAKVKSAFRLVALDAGAMRRGLRPMMALADARAMHPDLCTHDADPAGDAAARDAIVDWCRRFTPLAAIDGDDGAMLDIAGVAHLFGGETALMDDLRTRLAGHGFAATAAIADTPGAAWALARYGEPRWLEPGLAPRATARVFAPLPLAALRLDPGVIAQLGQAGLRRIGDLMMRPRAPIAARFGRDIHLRLDALLGLVKAPISPRFEAPAFMAERRFAEGLARQEDIEATILALAYDLCGLLARHGEGARRLDVALYRVDGVVKHIETGTSRPLRDPVAMARLFRERIAAAGEDGLETGYGFDVVRLAALAAERLDESQPGWIEEGGNLDAVADLVDRLGARFGLARVTRLAPADSHQPERASCESDEERSRLASSLPLAGRGRGSRRASPLARTHTPTPCPSLQGGGEEREKESMPLPERPIRLFERPEPIDTIAEVPDGPPQHFRWRRITHHVAAIEGPERIGPDWWLQGQGRPDARTRDYFRAEDTEGRRFWLYREGLYSETATPRWFVHGLFA